jgi:hypothetical protein
MNTISLKCNNLKKMIIVRNGKGKTFEEAISRRKTGNTLVLGQKKNISKDLLDNAIASLLVPTP